jgi:hypothetical protein
VPGLLLVVAEGRLGLVAGGRLFLARLEEQLGRVYEGLAARGCVTRLSRVVFPLLADPGCSALAGGPSRPVDVAAELGVEVPALPDRIERAVLALALVEPVIVARHANVLSA